MNYPYSACADQEFDHGRAENRRHVLPLGTSTGPGSGDRRARGIDLGDIAFPPSKYPEVGLVNICTTQHALLRRLLPEEKPDDLAVREGQFHTVVIGASGVVCLARTPVAAARLPARAAALRTVAGLDLDVGTPELLAQGGVDGSNEVPFLLLSRIAGEPLAADALDDAEVADAVAAQYAKLLAELDRAGADETVRAALPHAADGRWRCFAENVRAELFGLMSRSGRLRAERELAVLDSLPHLTAAVVHGDLGAENVRWEWEYGLPRLAGVIDWDEIALGDPAEDLAAVGASYGDDLLERVLALSRWSDDGLAARITAIRGTFALQQALYARRDGDEDELADGLADYR